MRIRPVNRRPLLFAVALLTTLIATWWASSLNEEPAAVVGSRKVPAQVSIQRRTTPPKGVLAIQRAPWPSDAAALMRASTPSVAIVPQPPPSPPETPPLPFRFIGTLENDGKRSVILQEDKETFIVHVGERVVDLYRVDRISATLVEFTYLPTHQRQTLDIAPSQ
jgi:hypothetical protein